MDHDNSRVGKCSFCWQMFFGFDMHSRFPAIVCLTCLACLACLFEMFAVDMDRFSFFNMSTYNFAIWRHFSSHEFVFAIACHACLVCLACLFGMFAVEISGERTGQISFFKSKCPRIISQFGVVFIALLIKVSDLWSRSPFQKSWRLLRGRFWFALPGIL